MSSTVLSSLIGVISGFFTYRYVSPEYLGIWLTLSTFTVYTSFLRLGIPNGMNREMPYYFGRKDSNRAVKYAETTLAYSISNSIFLLLAAVILLLALDFDQYQDGYKKAIFVFFIVIIVEPYSTYLSSTFRTSDNFKKLSSIQLIMSLIRVLSIYFVYQWEFNGYIFRELVMSITNMILLHLKRPLPSIKAKFSFPIFKELFNVGFMIFIASYSISLINTLPRLFLIKFGTTLEMGLFAPIILLLNTVILIPNTLNGYLFPKFSQKYGENAMRLTFWGYVKKLFLLSILISVFAGSITYLSIDYIIEFFPKYADAIPYIKMACLPIIFIGYNLGSVLFVVFKEWKWYLVYVISFGSLQLITLLIFRILLNDNLETVIFSLLVTYSLMFIISYILTYKITHSKDER